MSLISSILAFFKKISTVFEEPVIQQREPEPMYKLSAASLSRLSTVHPDLQKVIKRAIQITKVDFAVTQGKRTLEEQYALYGKGRTAEELANAGVPAFYAKPSEKRVSWTMKSNHLSGRAVDLAPYINGKLEWDDSGKLGIWPKINDAVQEAAKEVGVRVNWGGNWTTNVDRPHWELA